MRIERQKCPKFFFIFFFSWTFSKLTMFIGCLNAFVKCHDPLISIPQKLAMCYVPFSKNLGKTVKKKKGQFFGTFWSVKSYFFKNGPSKWVLFFFALQSVHQDASFKFSNVSIRRFSFFTFVRAKGKGSKRNAMTNGRAFYLFYLKIRITLTRGGGGSRPPLKRWHHLWTSPNSAIGNILFALNRGSYSD